MWLDKSLCRKKRYRESKVKLQRMKEVTILRIWTIGIRSKILILSILKTNFSLQNKIKEKLTLKYLSN